MKSLLLSAALIVFLSTPAYAHGEQVVYVLYSDAVIVVGWAIFLIIYKAPVLHKVGIFAVILLVVFLSWFLIEFWYHAAIEHPLTVSAGFVTFHTLVGYLILVLLRKLERSKNYS